MNTPDPTRIPADVLAVLTSPPATVQPNQALVRAWRPHLFKDE